MQVERKNLTRKVPLKVQKTVCSGGVSVIHKSYALSPLLSLSKGKGLYSSHCRQSLSVDNERPLLQPSILANCAAIIGHEVWVSKDCYFDVFRVC